MILPATAAYLGACSTARRRRGASTAVCERVAGLADWLVDAIDALEHAQHEAHEAGSVAGRGEGLRRRRSSRPRTRCATVADELETVVADDLWPLPKYRELLFQY